MLSSQGEERDHLANTELDYANSVSELMGSLTQAEIGDLTRGLGQGCISVPLLVASRGLCHWLLVTSASQIM